MVRIRGITSNYVLGGVLALALFAPAGGAMATGFKVLHAFAGGSDGCYPGSGSLILDNGGNLYGTTAGPTCGQTVFRLAADGTETILYYLPGGSGGAGPEALTIDKKGNLYGTACCGGEGGGVIFKISSDGTESLLHTFAGPPNDGSGPYAALIADGSGNFYGTTTGGGKETDGTVFTLAPNGTETVLHSFKGGRGGFFPFAGLILDANGNLYGVNAGGGAKDFGTAFEIAPDGAETVLHAFKGSSNDGSTPDGALVMGKTGSLYGTTFTGGRTGCYSNEGCGIVFKLAPDGTESILHFFTGKHGDGANPIAGLIADSSGYFYGTTEYGGSRIACNGTYGCGTVFEIGPDGTETILHSFGNGSHGANPIAGLVADSAGNLYGTTEFGGAYGYGTVFEITP